MPNKLPPFRGNALNAVDVKGRVSLPSAIRARLEMRADSAAADGIPIERNTIFVREHGQKDRLLAFDDAELNRRSTLVDEREADDPNADFLADDDDDDDNFGDYESISFDGAGRMVLNAMLRDFGKIENFAFFRARRQFIEIWDPKICYEWAVDKNNESVKRRLEYLCGEKGVAL